MSKDYFQKFMDKIKISVYENQKEILDSLIGKYVVRDGVTFLVVSVDKKEDTVIVSDVKTPVEQTTKFTIHSFLSKAVREVSSGKSKSLESED